MIGAVNVDIRPDVAVEMPCGVEMVDGAPSFVPHHRPRWRAVLARLVGKTVTVRIVRTKKRSTPANNYLWGIVYVDVLEGLKAIAEEAGEPVVFANADELHEAMKWRFLKRVRVLPGGEVIETPGSSAVLTMEQFSEFVSQIVAWAAGYGIAVRESDGG